MKLRSQILMYGLFGALMALLVGGVGFHASRVLGDSIAASVGAGQASRASSDADMAHDAIRGDVLRAMFGTLEGKPAQVEEAQRDLKEHAESFSRAMATLGKLSLSAESVSALREAEPSVARYIEAAQRAMRAIGTDVEAARREIAALQLAFSDLEKRIAALSDSIERSGQGVESLAAASIERSQLTIGAILLLTVALSLASAFWLSGHLARPLAQAVKVADRLAQGDLTVEVNPVGNAENVRLLEAMGRLRGKLLEIVEGVKANADEVDSASAQIAQGNLDLSDRTERQASAVQETAATMDQLGSTVRSNAEHAAQARQLTQRAADVAGEGHTVMAQAVETMRAIDQGSDRIAQIVGTIEGIAFQTNMLALNAAVEAARAAEHGRGFAVVAGEVRGLAQRSAQAAREIKSLVGASVEQIRHGAGLVDRAGQTMSRIVDANGQVAQIVANISDASAEQSLGVGQAGQAVAQIDESTQQNAALVEESAAAAQSLKQQSQLLVQAMAVFHTGTTARMA